MIAILYWGEEVEDDMVLTGNDGGRKIDLDMQRSGFNGSSGDRARLAMHMPCFRIESQLELTMFQLHVRRRRYCPHLHGRRTAPLQPEWSHEQWQSIYGYGISRVHRKRNGTQSATLPGIRAADGLSSKAQMSRGEHGQSAARANMAVSLSARPV